MSLDEFASRKAQSMWSCVIGGAPCRIEHDKARVRALKWGEVVPPGVCCMNEPRIEYMAMMFMVRRVREVPASKVPTT